MSTSGARSTYLSRRSALGALAVASVSPGLAGCSSVTIHYKLTLVLETPRGEARGSSVVAMRAAEVSWPVSGGGAVASGECVFVDLGPGRRPLLTSMTNWDHAKRGIEWVDGKFGTYGILKRYGIAPSDELLDHFRVLNRQIGKIIELAPRDLPPLVTFANINDPSSILPVDPQNISDALDQDVTWKRITFEITNEAVTRQIKKRLPWFDAYASKNFAGRKSSSRDVHPLLNESTALFTW